MKITSKPYLFLSGSESRDYGDEDISKKPEFKGNELGIWSRIAYSTQKYAVKGLWNDLSPADNNVTLKLK